MRALRLSLTCLIAVACARVTPPSATAAPGPPSFLVGSFADDYGNTFTVSTDEFFQRPRNRFRITRWDVAGQFLIARNDAANPSAPNRWTRIDWLRLADMAPYTWAFCFSAFDAPTERDAEARAIAQRATPRTGCNGFPFTRMRPVRE